MSARETLTTKSPDPNLLAQSSPTTDTAAPCFCSSTLFPASSPPGGGRRAGEATTLGTSTCTVAFSLALISHGSFKKRSTASISCKYSPFPFSLCNLRGKPSAQKQIRRLHYTQMTKISHITHTHTQTLHCSGRNRYKSGRIYM